MKSLSFYLFVLLTIIILSCKEDKILYDNEYTFEGLIIDNSTGIPIEGVMIGFKNHSLPDSTIFFNDSINIDYPQGFNSYMHTNDDGLYEFIFCCPNSRPNWILEDIFAYKSGYKLLRFQKNRDTVYQKTVRKDILNIKLELK